MKVKFKPSANLEFELEGSGQKEIFKELATVQEIFSEKACGLCKSEALKYVVRNVENNDYFELRCTSCGGLLSFGQHKKGGTLFPKRKDDNNDWLTNGGWHKWVPSENTDKKKK
jgi:hypothetical protein